MDELVVEIPIGFYTDRRLARLAEERYMAMHMDELVRRLRSVDEHDVSFDRSMLAEAADTLTRLAAALEGLVEAIEPSLAHDSERPCRICGAPDHPALLHGDRTRRLHINTPALQAARAALREVGRG